MTLTSKIVKLIRDYINEYEINSSAAKGKENEVNGLKSLKKSKEIEPQLLDARYYQTMYETQANTSKIAALRLFKTFEEDFDSNERSEVDELINTLR